MLVIPAIDLRSGRCVRLVQGRPDAMTVYSDEPETVARMFEEQGAELIHIVDLDGAFRGLSQNLSAVKAIVENVKCGTELGGGIRSLDDIERVLELGVSRVILGTIAVRRPGLVEEAVSMFGEKVVVGIDAKNGMVAAEGWLETSEVSALELANDMKRRGVKELIYTDISRDGTLTGPNLVELENIAKSGVSIIASGGISSLDDLIAVKQLVGKGIRGAIVGKAIYDGRFTLAQAIAAVNGMEKM